MKLLIITAISAFDDDVKLMLKKTNVRTYTYKKVTGFRDVSEESIENNWFASELNQTESILYYAFVKKENVTALFDLVTNFNSNQQSTSAIHIAVLNIEKSN